MKILLTTPSVNSVNGGIYVIIQWCNHLKSIYGHEVTLFSENRLDRSCNWRKLNVPVVTEFKTGYYDAVIICSPHSIWIEDVLTTERGFLFCQMHEALFNNDIRWQALCMKFYRSKLPMFSISEWNMQAFKDLGRTGEMIYIKNGIDFNDFPIKHITKSGNTILLESPESNNPTKDTDKMALRLAKELQGKGYRVVSYGARPLRDYKVYQHYLKPSLQVINSLYAEASVMIKATRYDARSLSPLEAMTKGCAVVRAVNFGDDDLKDGYNCFKSDYDYDKLRENAYKMLEDKTFRDSIVSNAYSYISTLTWDSVLNTVNDRLCK